MMKTVIGRTHYDRMDEIHYLDNNVSKEEFLFFLKPIVCGFDSFKHFENGVSKHLIDKATNSRYEENYDIIGGFFGVLGYYRHDFHLSFMPEDLRSCYIDDKNITERRFDWVLSSF